MTKGLNHCYRVNILYNDPEREPEEQIYLVYKQAKWEYEHTKEQLEGEAEVTLDEVEREIFHDRK